MATEINNFLRQHELSQSEQEQLVASFNLNLSQNTLIDKSCFETAKGILKSKFDNILNEYNEDTQIYINNMKNGLQTGNLEKIKDSAHPLKSSSYTLGFNRLGDIAKAVELAIKNQTDKNTALIFVSDNLPLLESAFVETQKALIREMAL